MPKPTHADHTMVVLFCRNGLQIKARTYHTPNPQPKHSDLRWLAHHHHAQSVRWSVDGSTFAEVTL